MTEVNFFLSTISGDCIILGSTVNKFPELPQDTRVDDPEVRAHAYFVKFDVSVDTYYISVFAYDTSYYTVTASVSRKNADGDTVVSELTLL